MKNTYYFLTRQYWLLLLIGALSVALSTNAHAQSPIPPVNWQRILDKSILYTSFHSEEVLTLALVRSTDGGCAIVAMAYPNASAFITKLNAGGGVEWTTPLQGSPTATSLQATPDGGYMVAKNSQGNPNFIEIERISSAGALLYRKPVNIESLPIGTGYQYSLRDLVPSPDGGFLVSGYQTITNNPNNTLNILLVKIDSNGNTTWAKTVDNLGSTFLYRVNTASEGGYLVHSTTNSQNLTGSIDKTDFRVYNFRINEQGVIQWQRIGGPPASFFNFAPTGDGYVAIGSHNGLPGMSVLKLNRNLDIIKATSLSDTYMTDASERTAVKPTSDGGCIVVDSYTGNGRDYRITKFNSELAIEWQEKGSGSGIDVAQRVVVNPDGTYIISGTTNSPNFPGRTDNSSNFLIWVRKQAAKAPALALTAPNYNCATGAFTFNTTGGDGAPITYFAPGITGPTTNPNQFVDIELRQAADAQPLSLSATQSGVTATYVFDLRATCPIGTNPPVQTNQDRAVLVELYNATNGPGWLFKSNWLQSDSPCGWYGVSCDGTGRVISLLLPSNDLKGTLPTSVGNLSQLTHLDLRSNELLAGTFPASLGNLSQLITLNLGYTRLSGEIPGSLGNLSKLRVLTIGGRSDYRNTLTGSIPASLGNLSQLQSLGILFTAITGEIPASLGKLSNLEILTLSVNQLSGSIPTTLSKLSKLGALFLDSNLLSGSIPSFLGNLPQLQQLALGYNSLSGCLPTELRSLCGKLISLTNNPGLPGGGDFASFCSNGTGACTTTPTTGLALIAPTYDCGTGAFTFNTTGGNGSTIEYQAPGITGWTTNPNQFVDRESRTANDVQPFTLMARQSGTVVTYTWNLKQACGRARLAADEVGTTLSLQVLGNPAREQVRVLITGAEGQAVQLRLTDLQGRLLESRTVEQAVASEEQQFRLDQAGPHLLLLQATKQQQIRTVKIIRQ